MVLDMFHFCRLLPILGPGGRRRRHDDNTETPDPGQPPLPGTKYPVRVSPHFDKLSGALKFCFRKCWPIFLYLPRFVLPIWAKLGLRDENIGRDLHFAPVDGPRTFLKKYFWSRYYCNFGFSIIYLFFELFMASPGKTTILTSFGPIWSLFFRS